jgi:NADPH:quinone reductase-like Zn-dependent oxidoreductase
VLIHAAAGGVGTLAAQFARLAGARRIVGVVGSSTKIEYAEQFGYDQILVSDKGLDERFDVVLDSVGGQTRRASLELLAPQGRLAAYGNASGANFSVSTTS